MPMIKRKDLKQKGKHSLKKHYLIFAAVCLISAFLASEFSGSLNFSTLRNYQEISAHPEEYTELSSVSKRGSAGMKFWKMFSRIIWKKEDSSLRIFRNRPWPGLWKAIQCSGRTRGVLSSIINQFSSGSILVTFAAAVNSLTGTEKGGIVILILLGTAGLFAFWFFIQNTFGVILRRIFLEGRIYEKVPIFRFLYLLRIKSG